MVVKDIYAIEDIQVLDAIMSQIKVQMTNKKYKEKLEKEFKLYLKLLNRESFVLFNEYYGEEVNQDERNTSDYWCNEYVLRMFNIVCVYLEHLGFNDYLSEFKSRFAERQKEDSNLVQYEMFPIAYGDFEHELGILIEWRRLLSPFDLFGNAEQKEIDEKISRLINLLECTNEIIKFTKTIVKREDDINSMMRSVANWYFTGVYSYTEGYFVHKFKHYRPDLIVKEIGVAVEYKLVRQESEIGNKLDELLIDAKRYSGNHHNRICIAVFCLSNIIEKTKKEIREEWTTMEFPVNWRLLIISDVVIS